MKLDQLPDGLAFPADLRERVSYDPAGRRLVFRGFMTKSQFDALTRLDDDLAYRRAVDELFRLSTEPDDGRSRWFRRLLVALVVLVLLLAAVVWGLLLSDAYESGARSLPSAQLGAESKVLGNPPTGPILLA